MPDERWNRLRGRLRLPVMAAPMFLVSGPRLVLAASRAGIIGAFPAVNAREIADLHRWCARLRRDCPADRGAWAVSVNAHKTYARACEELDALVEHQPPLVLSALGDPRQIVETVSEYGGLVFADVSSPTLAHKALERGVDGLVLVCAGAGGHTGRYSPFALTRAVRRFWDGPLMLAGAIGDGRGIRAAEVLGADVVSMGTSFIATREALASDDYRRMCVASSMEDVITSSAVSGSPANWLRDTLPAGTRAPGASIASVASGARHPAWKSVWSAGHGVGLVDRTSTVAELVNDLDEQYRADGRS